MTDEMLSPMQIEFIQNSFAKWNIAHGAVRTGKTVGTLFRFMQAADQCPDSQIFMVGYTSDTIFENAIRLLLESPQLAIFRPFCTWYSGARKLTFRGKTIKTMGAKDEGAIGQFQGKTMSLVYCDEMTLYPESIVDMIDSRLSNPWSMGFAACNPSHPNHKIKKWIDMAEEGDKNYYAQHYVLDDNPFIGEDYKQRIINSSSGLFYKRNVLGLWCMAEGSIYDFFDRKIHVVDTPPAAAEYWIAGVDYGTKNAFCCLLIGVSTGRHSRTGKRMWVEKEYYWDSEKKERQKTNSEYVEDIVEFLEPYAVQALYCDPSAASFKIELQRKGITFVDAYNDVLDGISVTTSEMKKGNLFICSECTNLIREIEGYVWDNKKALIGKDEPVKRDDHACVTGDTLITVLNYKQVPIQELSEKSLRKAGIKNYNINIDRIESDTYCNPSLTREKAEIYELELEDGTILKATGDHQILTQRGFVELRQLMLCDTVMKCNSKYISERNST